MFDRMKRQAPNPAYYIIKGFFRGVRQELGRTFIRAPVRQHQPREVLQLTTLEPAWYPGDILQ